MTKLYKLTDQHGCTYNNTQWGEGITHTASGKGDMCGPGWIHAYTDPLLAVLLNPIHANFDNPLLWEGEGEIGKTDYGLKVGCKTFTTLRQIPIPDISIEQRMRFGILCSLDVYTEPSPWTSESVAGAKAGSAAAAGAHEAARCAIISAATLAAKAAEAAASAGNIDMLNIAKAACNMEGSNDK